MARMHAVLVLTVLGVATQTTQLDARSPAPGGAPQAITTGPLQFVGTGSPVGDGRGGGMITTPALSFEGIGSDARPVSVVLLTAELSFVGSRDDWRSAPQTLATLGLKFIGTSGRAQ